MRVGPVTELRQREFLLGYERIHVVVCLQLLFKIRRDFIRYEYYSLSSFKVNHSGDIDGLLSGHEAWL